MSDLYLQLDYSELEKLGESIKDLERKVQEEAGKLAAMTHAHIVEEAQEKLHSRRQKFLDNLAFSQVDQDTWVITVQRAAVWIEEGKPSGSMVDDLLGDNPKISKDGVPYRVIPFEHSKAPTQQTTAQQNLTATVKQALKERNIPYGGIERDDKGKPKTGLLHKFDIMDKPIRQDMGRGQGQGPVGQVQQGNTGIPLLQGVRVYQKALFNDDGTPKVDKQGQQRASRSIMTFRVVSARHKGNKWEYPGIEGMGFLDEAEEWAYREWSENILPRLLKSVGVE